MPKYTSDLTHKTYEAIWIESERFNRDLMRKRTAELKR